MYDGACSMASWFETAAFRAPHHEGLSLIRRGAKAPSPKEEATELENALDEGGYNMTQTGTGDHPRKHP